MTNLTESLAKLRATLAADKRLRDAATSGPWRLRAPEEQPNGSRLGATLVETARPSVPLVSAVCEVWYAGRGNEAQDAAWIANSACPVRAQQMADVVGAMIVALGTWRKYSAGDGHRFYCARRANGVCNCGFSHVCDGADKLIAAVKALGTTSAV